MAAEDDSPKIQCRPYINASYEEVSGVAGARR